jgi:hypothetical protein
VSLGALRSSIASFSPQAVKRARKHPAPGRHVHGWVLVCLLALMPHPPLPLVGESAGFVPRALAAAFPDARVVRSSNWCHFPEVRRQQVARGAAGPGGQPAGFQAREACGSAPASHVLQTAPRDSSSEAVASIPPCRPRPLPPLTHTHTHAHTHTHKHTFQRAALSQAYCCPLLLDPQDPLFARVGAAVVRQLRAAFGPEPPGRRSYYIADRSGAGHTEGHVDFQWMPPLPQAAIYPVLLGT